MADRATGMKPEGQKRWRAPSLRHGWVGPVEAFCGLIVVLVIVGLGMGCGSTRNDGGDAAGTEARAAPERILLEMAGGIAVVNADGSGYKRLTDGSYGQEEGSGDWGGAWSPDGTRIAFVSIRDGNPAAYVMAADGSDQKNITNNAGLFGLAWSPGGEQIAVVSVKAGESQDVYVVNADGSGQLNLTGGGSLHPAGWAIQPTEQLSWSPDGTLIAFGSAPHEGAQGINPGGIALAHADGSGGEELTAAMELSPAWSPDGSRIAYLAGAGELHVMNAEGSGDLLVAGGSKGSEVQSYAWSPDGTRLAFNYMGGQVYAVNSDGSCRTPLTADPHWTDSPTWSPDGSRIAYVANVDGGVGLWQMDADGSGEEKLDLPEDYGLSRAAWGPGARGGVGGPGPLTCAADAAPADAMIVRGRVGYLEGVAARTGEIQKSYVGAFAGGWREVFCVQVLAEEDGSFELEVPAGCFQGGETVWLTAGGMNACPTPPFKAGTMLEVVVKGSTIVTGCDGETPRVQPLGVPSLLAPANFAAIPQNDPGSGCPPDPYRGYGYRIVFDWTEATSVSGIRGYWFRLEVEPDHTPVHETFVTDSTFTYVQCNAFVSDNRLVGGWHWRVLAEDKAGNRSEWSKRGDFHFEPCRADGVPCSAP